MAEHTKPTQIQSLLDGAERDVQHRAYRQNCHDVSNHRQTGLWRMGQQMLREWVRTRSCLLIVPAVQTAIRVVDGLGCS